MHSLLLLLVVAAHGNLPQTSQIVDSRSAPGDEPVGNVLVTFTDGHKEKWTKLGRAEQACVSMTGLVGWAVVTGRNERGDSVDSKLRICWPDGHHRDFEPELPFIEEWQFSEDSRAVVIKSRAAHGCANYDEYDVASGKLLGHAHCLFGKNLPMWAQPFSD